MRERVVKCSEHARLTRAVLAHQNNRACIIHSEAQAADPAEIGYFEVFNSHGQSLPPGIKKGAVWRVNLMSIDPANPTSPRKRRGSCGIRATEMWSSGSLELTGRMSVIRLLSRFYQAVNPFQPVFVETGKTHESVYRSFSDTCNPGFRTAQNHRNRAPRAPFSTTPGGCRHVSQSRSMAHSGSIMGAMDEGEIGPARVDAGGARTRDHVDPS